MQDQVQRRVAEVLKKRAFEAEAAQIHALLKVPESVAPVTAEWVTGGFGGKEKENIGAGPHEVPVQKTVRIGIEGNGFGWRNQQQGPGKLTIPAGTALLIYPAPGLVGQPQIYVGPQKVQPDNFLRKPINIQSAAVVPANMANPLDTANKAMEMIKKALDPAGGCLVEEADSLINSLNVYAKALDTYLGIRGALAYRTQIERMLQAVPQMKAACGKGEAAAQQQAAQQQAAQQQKAAAAPGQCPAGTFYASSAAIAQAYQRAGYVEQPANCYGAPCPKGSFRAATPAEAAAYSNAGWTQVRPGCWGKGGEQPDRQRQYDRGYRRDRYYRQPQRRRQAKSYAGDFLRRETISPNVRLRVGHPVWQVGGIAWTW